MTHGARRHIGFFLAELRDGGVPRQTLQLSAELARRGHRVSLLPAISGGVRERDVDPAVELVRLDQGWLPRLAAGRRTVKQQVLAATPALAAWLRHAAPDALIAADHWPNFTAVGARALSRRGTPLMLTQRVPLSVRARQHRSIGLLARALYPRAEHVASVSHALAADLEEQVPALRDRVDTLYNPVVTPDFAERADRPADHPWLQERDVPVVLSAGRLTRQKDYPTLLRAFARMRRVRPLRLLVLGEGPDRAALERLALELGVAHDVDFPGFVPDTLPYLAAASVFALTSEWEGLPAALIEALYCGCPVVSTNCPTGPEEILLGGTFGALVPVGDVDAVEFALADALDKPPDPKRLQERALQFSLEASVHAYLDTLFPGDGPAR
jgi:glycosyltransferase involved in cell wall biosynthesis